LSAACTSTITSHRIRHDLAADSERNARLARILVIEKGLVDRVEFIQAKTRAVGNPYYQINPSGRGCTACSSCLRYRRQHLLLVVEMITQAPVNLLCWLGC
jgi:hypothetical protein